MVSVDVKHRVYLLTDKQDCAATGWGWGGVGGGWREDGQCVIAHKDKDSLSFSVPGSLCHRLYRAVCVIVCTGQSVSSSVPGSLCVNTGYIEQSVLLSLSDSLA